MAPKKTDTSTAVVDPIDAASAEVVRLRDRELEIWRDRQQRVAALLELEATTGRGVADGGSVADAGRSLAAGRAALDVLDRAADEVARQREAAVPLIWRAQAVKVRAEASAEREQIAARQPRVKELLVELRELEQVDFEPKVLIEPSAIGQLTIHRFNSLSVVQRAHADRLDAEASTLERQELSANVGGMVSNSSIDDLIVAGLGDGRHVFPPLRDVERKALEVELAGRKRLQRTREGYGEATPDPDSAPATWTLNWRGREIADLSVSFLGNVSSTDDYFARDRAQQVVPEEIADTREPVAVAAQSPATPTPYDKEHVK